MSSASFARAGDVRTVRFAHVEDDRGTLTAAETGDHVPFPIQRVFYVHSVTPGVDRGGHAHRETDQVLTCIAGRMRVDVSDGADTRTFTLDDPATGIYVPRMLWTRLYDFDPDAVLAVYANTLYDRSKSIRTWEEFRASRGIGPAVRAPGSADSAQALEPAQLEQLVLESALTQASRHSRDELAAWLEERQAVNRFSVERKPLDRLRGWKIDPQTGNVLHESGRFFQVVGLRVRTNRPAAAEWLQPIINQPEIGVLGFLAARFDGVLHFLMQAKMEPGNVNLLQLSPTVQATRSNFTRVHGGARPAYIEHFLTPHPEHLLLDQLQSEQGTRFLRKRNRNIVVFVPDGDSIPVLDDFRWMTLAQIHECLRQDNVVNMDSRTVLSGLRLSGKLGGRSVLDLRSRVLRSRQAGRIAGRTESVIRWMTGQRFGVEIDTQVVPLRDVQDWQFDGEAIRHRDGRYFGIVGVTVRASSREVTQWDQPLIESAPGGTSALLCETRDGVLHALVRARVEPGSFDLLELGPSVQFAPINYPGRDRWPPFADLLERLRPEQILYDVVQSEEGGRFFHDTNRYVIAEVLPGQVDAIPDDYRWVTFGDLEELVALPNYVNVELRTLLAAIGVG